MVRNAISIWLSLGMMVLAASPKKQAQGNEKLSAWLISFLDDSGNSDVADKIRTIAASDSKTTDILLKASSLISQHKESFSWPDKSENSTEAEVYQSLLIAWEIQYSGSGMAGTIPPESHKISQTLIPSHWIFTHTFLLHRIAPKQMNETDSPFSFTHNGSFKTTPMSSGVSIGAP